MRLLGIERSKLKSLGAINTAQEISQQPILWRKLYDKIQSNQDELKEFMSIVKRDCNKIILTGAGTSAYLGISLRGIFFKKLGLEVVSVPTTDLVTNPKDFITGEDRLLMISFARSGNSPESLAAVELCDKLAKKCAHLIITCNPDGALFKYESRFPRYDLLMPHEANDKSLAMTSSYSCMLLAGTLVAHVDELDLLEDQISLLACHGEALTKNYSDLLQEISNKPFDRMVCLGSGAFLGTATEARLKMLELTGGKVVTSNDSFLGFRHGPKAIINEKTLMVYFFSNDPYVMQYEKDLIRDTQSDSYHLLSLGITHTESIADQVDIEIKVCNNVNIHKDLLPVGYIVPLQILSFHKSIQLGLNPDLPSTNGAIHRVVQGVNIYSFKDQY